MPRVTKKAGETQAKQDVLEVIHHEIPDTAAAAGAAAIPAPRTESDTTTAATTPAAAQRPEMTASTAKRRRRDPAYGTQGMTWRRLLRGVAIAEVIGQTTLFVAGILYGLGPFVPLLVAVALFGVAALLIPRMTKASVVYSLVVASLTLVMFGGLFFGWAGFLYPRSWFEMSFATLTVLVPIAGVTAAIATLRGRNGDDAARTPTIVTAVVCTAVVVAGMIGAATATDATRLPGDVRLTASGMEFEQKALTATAGDVAIYFENTDPIAHNVHIDGHGTSPDASGRQSVRYVFRGLAAGTYAYFCAIHTDMKGTLTVT